MVTLEIAGWMVGIILFTLPAWLWLKSQPPFAAFSFPELCGLSFIVSFGLFAAVTGPLLLLHRPYIEATAIVAAIWLFSTIWSWNTFRKKKQTTNPLPSAPSFFLPDSHTITLAFFLAILTWIGSVLFVHGALRRLNLSLLFFIISLNLIFSVQCWLRHTRLSPTLAAASGIKFNRNFKLLVIIPVILVALMTTLSVREDFDDVLYLSESLSLQASQSMASKAPTERGEALPPTAIYNWQSFELLGAMLSSFSGLHPMIGFRTAMAPVVWLLSIALWGFLLHRILPPWAWSIGMVALIAYFVFGMSSHWTPNNFLLPRPAQGKTWLMHIAAPALIGLTGIFLSYPHPATFIVLLLASFAGLGFSATGTFLVPILVGASAIMTCFEIRRIPIRACLSLGLVILPEICFAAWLLMHANGLAKDISMGGFRQTSSWHDIFLSQFNVFHGGGALEIFLLAAAPQLLIWSSSRRALQPLTLSSIILAGAMNPLLYPFLGKRLLGITAYERFLWAVPLPLLVAGLAAGWAHLAAGRHRNPTKALAALIIFLFLFPLGGAHFVFSKANIYFSTLPAPYLASNLYKMPQGLLEIAQMIQKTGTTPQQRILCSERDASHLAPFSLNFGFVYTRSYQTEAALLLANRKDEIAARKKAARDLLKGLLPDSEALFLLKYTQPKWIVLDPDSPLKLKSILKSAGFTLRIERNKYQLWEHI